MIHQCHWGLPMRACYLILSQQKKFGATLIKAKASPKGVI
jgi:hypothetical protein